MRSPTLKIGASPSANTIPLKDVGAFEPGFCIGCINLLHRARTFGATTLMLPLSIVVVIVLQSRADDLRLSLRICTFPLGRGLGRSHGGERLI
jgi:hypothetical protein